MARKVILDVDPGIDDALAVMLALFDPRLEVVAVTAVAGNVAAQQSTRNVQAIIERLDPPRWPRIGTATHRDLPTDARHLHGADGLGGNFFEVAELHHQHPSYKVITDEARSTPDQVTIITMGPLTNLALAFQRDVDLAKNVGQLIIMGGTYREAGNVTATAEFNFYCDPEAARAVLRSPTTKTLVPLDVTHQVMMTYDRLAELPPETTKAGRFVRQILPFAFQSYRQQLGLEGIYLHDVVALMAAVQPELFQTEMATCDVETAGELTSGMCIVDRRPNQNLPHNLAVAVDVDEVAVMDSIMRGIAQAAQSE